MVIPEIKKFRTIKPEIRVLGIDDGPFTLHVGHAPIVGVVFRGGYWFDGVLATKIKVDGFDATDKIASMTTSSAHYKQLRIIMLDGLTFGGFNVVDIKKLYDVTHMPVIVVTRRKPNFNEIRAALDKLPGTVERWQAMCNAGETVEVQTRKNESVYIEKYGLTEEDARKIVKFTSTRSSVPEALRVAHLIASGLFQL
jgi:endonuclease V-like protein UPF0215 family